MKKKLTSSNTTEILFATVLVQLATTITLIVPRRDKKKENSEVASTAKKEYTSQKQISKKQKRELPACALTENIAVINAKGNTKAAKYSRKNCLGSKRGDVPPKR